MSLLFSFKGRIGRAKFWLANLVAYLLVALIVIIVMLIVPPEQLIITDPETGMETIDILNPIVLTAYLVLLVVTTWISLAIGTKRFHDRGKSGWWNLIALIPLIGGFWWLIELGCLRGDPGPNAYGPPVVSV